MKRLTWIIAIALILLPAGISYACPGCKDGVPSMDAESPNLVPVAINNSVYYMLGGLFATIGLLATVITKGVMSTNAHMTQKMTNDQTRNPNR